MTSVKSRKNCGKNQGTIGSVVFTFQVDTPLWPDVGHSQLRKRGVCKGRVPTHIPHMEWKKMLRARVPVFQKKYYFLFSISFRTDGHICNSRRKLYAAWRCHEATKLRITDIIKGFAMFYTLRMESVCISYSFFCVRVKPCPYLCKAHVTPLP